MAPIAVTRWTDPLCLAALPFAGYYLGRLLGHVAGGRHVGRLTPLD